MLLDAEADERDRDACLNSNQKQDSKHFHLWPVRTRQFRIVTATRHTCIHPALQLPRLIRRNVGPRPTAMKVAVA